MDDAPPAFRLEQAGEIGLLLAGVDMRIPMVLEHAEPAIQANVDTRGLHHAGVEWVDGDPPVVDLRQEVAIRKQHPTRLPVSSRGDRHLGSVRATW